jgi:plasmid maintenance system antidote protein VapI
MHQSTSIFLKEYDLPYTCEVIKPKQEHRYSLLIKALGVKSINEFENQIEVPNSTIRKAIDRNSDITGEVARKIKTRYPDVNTDWLLSGEGVILRGKYDSAVGEAEVEYNKKKGPAQYILNAILKGKEIWNSKDLTPDQMILMANIQKLAEEQAKDKKKN